MKNGAEAPISLTDICSMSCVNEIVQHKLFNAVADGIHTARPFKVIGGFEFLRNTFNFGVLTDQ